MKKILVALLAFVSLSVFAESEWVLITSSKENNYKVEGKKGSFVNSDKYGMIITRASMTGKQSVYNVVVMTKEDCSSGVGKVTYLKTSFDFSHTSDYVSRGGTNAQNVGDLICDLLNKPNV
jgi:hypothetical protein